jgi:hypothetical protein
MERKGYWRRRSATDSAERNIPAANDDVPATV